MIMIKRQKISISNKNLKNSTSDIEADKGRTTILNLPDEILLKIFSHLKSSCLLHSVSLVCKAWKALAEDSSLWKSLYLNRVTKADFVKILSKYQFVQEISIYNCTLKSSSVRALSQLSGLRSLIFSDCSIPNFKIKGSLRKLHLTSLYLYGTKNPNRIFEIIDPSILKNLEIMAFNDEEENFIENLKKCTQLEDVWLDYAVNLNDESVNYIIDILSDRLVKFCIIGDHTESAFFNLTKCLNLSELTINIESFGTLNNSILFQIMNLSKLKYLKLEPCNSITSEGIRRLFMGDQMGNLKYLILRECTTLFDSDLITVANCCKKLSYLKLEHNDNITDVGVSALVNNCPKIVELRLFNVYNLKGTFLLEIVEKNLLKNLRVMFFYASSIERNYVVALEAARPKIQIVNRSLEAA